MGLTTSRILFILAIIAFGLAVFHAATGFDLLPLGLAFTAGGLLARTFGD